MTTPRRLVSLVPSLTETLASLGAADRVVGVTRYCLRGAPPGAVVVGGTKNPSLAAVRDLRPDLVLANAEENRATDLDALRAAGLPVLVTFPRTVPQVRAMLAEVAARIGAEALVTPLLADLDAAQREAAAVRPRVPVPALTLIWRKPWMAVGPGTYVDDLLARCGFANVLAGCGQRYPRLDPALPPRPAVVLLPSEPYAFTAEDLPAVRGLLGEVAQRFVDGHLLTWHGPRTAAALRTFSSLAARLSGEPARAAVDTPGVVESGTGGVLDSTRPG